MNKQHFVITGASGLLGAMLCWRYSQAGHRVTAMVRDPQSFAPGLKGGIECLAGDLAQPQAMADELRRVAADVVVHCAALTNVDYCESHPEETMAKNAAASGRLAEGTARGGARFVFISTDSVYGRGNGPHKEEDAGGAISVYAKSKLGAEQRIMAAHPAALILRTCHFGCNALAGRGSLAEWMVDNLRSGRELNGFVDARFSPLFTETVAEMILAALQTEISGVYNLGSADGGSKFDFAVRLATKLGFDPAMVKPQKQADMDFAAVRPRDPVMDSGRFYRAVGLDPPSLDAEIEKFLIFLGDGRADAFRAWGRQP